MIILLSPAKTLDFSRPMPENQPELPRFQEKADQIAATLKRYSVQDLMKLLNISQKLAQINFERFQQWNSTTSLDSRRPAVLAYKGDVYDGLQTENMTFNDLEFARKHLRILSGLYGLLGPLDLIQPYRLEMGTPFGLGGAQDLYAYWKQQITDSLKKELEQHEQPFIINLASQEYSKSIDFKKMRVNVITPEFKDAKEGKYKMISFYAKRARGLMASWLIRHRINDSDALVSFASEGYFYNPRLSTNSSPVFTRG